MSDSLDAILESEPLIDLAARRKLIRNAIARVGWMQLARCLHGGGRRHAALEISA
jgi:hypothetical protein